jgi:hypothetical protein
LETKSKPAEAFLFLGLLLLELLVGQTLKMAAAEGLRYFIFNSSQSHLILELLARLAPILAK